MIRKSILYFFGNALSKVLVFLLLPLYTHFFDVAAYGTVDTLTSLIPVLVSIGFLDIYEAVIKFSYNNMDRKGVNVFFSTTLFLSLLFLFPYAVITFCLSQIILYKHFYLVFIYGLVYVYQIYFSYAARAFRKPVIFTVSGAISTAGELTCNLILVLGFGFGVDAILISGIVGRLVSILFILVNVLPGMEISFRNFNRGLCRKTLLFTFPLAINSLMFWGMGNINRLISYKLLGPEIGAYIGITNKFMLVIAVLTNVVSMAWQESALDVFSDENRAEKYSTMLSKFSLLLGTFIAVYLSFVTIIFPYYIGKEYWASFAIIPLALMSTWFSGISSILGQLFTVENVTNKIIWGTFVGCVLNIACLYFLVPLIGISAVYFALIAGFLANDIIRFAALRTVIRLRIDVKYLAITIGIMLSAAFICTETRKPILLGISALIDVLLLLAILRKDVMGIAVKIRSLRRKQVEGRT